MAIQWHDVSIPLRRDTTVWPSDPPFELSHLNRIAAGDSSNTSRVSMSTHTGTHIDAPWHFCEEGPCLDQVDTSMFFGEAFVFEILEADVITAPELGPSPLPARILLKTRNSDIPFDAPFRRDYVAIASDAAQRLADENVRLVGVDYLSVAPYKQEGQDTHRTLLGHNILAVEGLRLSGIRPGWCQFIVLPLHIVGADGAPCRAFAGLEESL